MQPVKKQLEILLMHYFRQCYGAFPKGKLVPSESPDFIVNLKTRNRIGIELTRLYPGSSAVSRTEYSEYHHFQMNVIELSKMLFENNSKLKLFVKVLFAENKPADVRGNMMTAVQITNAIRKALKNKKSGDIFYIVVDKNNLPSGLEKILITSHPALEVSVWERSDNLGISENILEDINVAIVKKDEKLRLYHRQNLNLYWLIITTDRLKGTMNHKIQLKLLNSDFRSRFQNVYLFDLIKSNILQLV